MAAQAQYSFSRSNVLAGRHLGSRFNLPPSRGVTFCYPQILTFFRENVSFMFYFCTDLKLFSYISPIL